MVSQKCHYAVRATFELARHYGRGPVRISDIAESQKIPMRFLQVILNQLRGAGLVQSKRGAEGGYFLPRPPREVTVGQIIQAMDGPLAPVACMASARDAAACGLHGRCVFIGMWKRAEDAVSAVYDATSFQDLVEEEKRMQGDALFAYSI